MCLHGAISYGAIADPVDQQGEEMSADASASMPAVPGLGGPVVPVLSGAAASVPATNVTVNVAAPQPVVIMNRATSGPGIVVRSVWFLAVGWWASGLALFAAWVLMASVVGIPLGVMLLNKVPQIQTLRARSNDFSVENVGGVTVIGERGAEQHPLGLRAVYFVFFGAWAGLAATVTAWVLSLGIVTLPLSVMLINRLPAVTTLQKN